MVSGDPSRGHNRARCESMRFTLLTLLLAGCASTFTPSSPVGFEGTWRGPAWEITFTGGAYQMRGRTGQFNSDLRAIYFTEDGNPATAAITCLYTLAGDKLVLRDCGYAGEYKR
jgi:hypothetical protein